MGSALIEYQDENDTRVTGATAWRGATWLGEMSLEASSGDELTTSASIVGDGVLEDFTQ
jgi:hypothetical protein